MEDSEEGQRLRFLENEIHKTNLKLMEGETIRKKYNAILDMLKKERLTFGNQLESLEGTLRKQEDEIEKLKVSFRQGVACQQFIARRVCRRRNGRPSLRETWQDKISTKRKLLYYPRAKRGKNG